MIESHRVHRFPEAVVGGDELTLPAFLARRARGASDGRLVADAVGGLLAGAIVLTLRPPAWPVIASAASCFLAFGAWGIADRTISERAADRRGLRALRALRAGMAAFGAAGALALIATAMALMLGTWIS